MKILKLKVIVFYIVVYYIKKTPFGNHLAYLTI